MRIMRMREKTFHWIVVVAVIALTGQGVCGKPGIAKEKSFSIYDQWETIGKYAAERSVDMIKKAAAVPKKGNMVVLTNAGRAEVNGGSTQGALDGLASVAGAGRGNNTLVEINSSLWAPLWFAVYDKASGYCAYLELDSSKASKIAVDTAASMELFSVSATERIDAAHLFRHAAEYEAKFSKKVFGGNDFRIVTIANAVAAGAPPYLIRTVEFHNHYCPGITSGILTALYIKAHFPSPKSGYFVHALEHWCKEDALMLLLNASPATGSYAISYPSEAEKAARTKEAKSAATIVYRQDDKTNKWEGLVLGFEWAETSCAKKGNGVVDKLCADLWYLERIEKPEDFVKVIKTFNLPDGVTPKDWLKPGSDPLKMLGLAK